MLGMWGRLTSTRRRLWLSGSDDYVSGGDVAIGFILDLLSRDTATVREFKCALVRAGAHPRLYVGVGFFNVVLFEVI